MENKSENSLALNPPRFTLAFSLPPSPTFPICMIQFSIVVSIFASWHQTLTNRY